MTQTEVTKVNLSVYGEVIAVFGSKQDWINRARCLPRKNKNEVRLYFDRNGAALKTGADFEATRLADAYPVTVYRIARASEIENYEL